MGLPGSDSIDPGRFGINNRARNRREAITGGDLLADRSVAKKKLARDVFPPDVTGGPKDLREPAFHVDSAAVAEEQGDPKDGGFMALGTHNHDRTYAQEKLTTDSGADDADYVAGFTSATDAPFDAGGGVDIDYQMRVVSWTLTAGLQPSPQMVYARYSRDAGATWSKWQLIGRTPPGIDQFFYRAESRWNFDPTTSPATTVQYHVLFPNHAQSTALKVPRTGTDGKLAIGFMPSTLATDAEVAAATPLVYRDGSVPGGNTVANSNAQTDLASTYTIPANRLKVGSVVRVRLFGTYGTALAGPTLLLRVIFGSVVIATTGAATMTLGVSAGNGWCVEMDAVVVSIGATASIEAQGRASYAISTTTGLLVFMPNVSPATVDSTGTLAVKVNVQWGTADASNTITLRTMTVEILDVP